MSVELKPLSTPWLSPPCSVAISGNKERNPYFWWPFGEENFLGRHPLTCPSGSGLARRDPRCKNGGLMLVGVCKVFLLSNYYVKTSFQVLSAGGVQTLPIDTPPPHYSFFSVKTTLLLSIAMRYLGSWLVCIATTSLTLIVLEHTPLESQYSGLKVGSNQSWW